VTLNVVCYALTDMRASATLAVSCVPKRHAQVIIEQIREKHGIEVRLIARLLQFFILTARPEAAFDEDGKDSFYKSRVGERDLRASDKELRMAVWVNILLCAAEASLVHSHNRSAEIIILIYQFSRFDVSFSI